MKHMTLSQVIARRDKANQTALTRLGPKISTVEHLALHAANKRSVFVKGTWGLLPAVVVMNMAASCVLRAIQSERVFEYEPPVKNERSPKSD